ncbi:reverse transcriptase domain-containing protein [Tanacetum coccineum]
MILELANRGIYTPAGIARDFFVLVGKFTFPADFVIVDYESDPRVPLILGRPFLQTARALIDFHGEEMILRYNVERLILNMRHDTSNYSNQPHKESINMIYFYNVSYEDYLEDLFATNHLSGNPTPTSDPIVSSSPTLTSLEEKKLLNHDPTKEMDSILEDSVNEDDVDDDLFELESDNDDVYDDPFDSKEDKIKESKLLIDELDPLRSSDFLPSPECDSVLYKDFSEVDALPSTNNEDKVFNPGIVIHENLFEVTIRVTPDKNEKTISISNAYLILEDFNPPLYELPFYKEVPGSETLLSFSSKMRKRFSTLGFLNLKEFTLLFSQNYLIGALKLSKLLKFLKDRWRFFLALMERTSVFWMFRVSIFIPHEQLNSGMGRAK